MRSEMVPRKRNARTGSDEWMEGKGPWKNWGLRAAPAAPCCRGQSLELGCQQQSQQSQGPPCLLLRSFPKYSALQGFILPLKKALPLPGSVSFGPTSELTQLSLPSSSFRTGYMLALSTFPFTSHSESGSSLESKWVYSTGPNTAVVLGKSLLA